jgi:hypothetical protein
MWITRLALKNRTYTFVVATLLLLLVIPFLLIRTPTERLALNQYSGGRDPWTRPPAINTKTERENI